MAAMENPIVTVRMPGYQVSVMGEVARPGTFTVSREKITVLEALAQAGDLGDLFVCGHRRDDRLPVLTEAALNLPDVSRAQSGKRSKSPDRHLAMFLAILLYKVTERHGGGLPLKVSTLMYNSYKRKARIK